MRFSVENHGIPCKNFPYECYWDFWEKITTNPAVYKSMGFFHNFFNDQQGNVFSVPKTILFENYMHTFLTQFGLCSLFIFIYHLNYFIDFLSLEPLCTLSTKIILWKIVNLMRDFCNIVHNLGPCDDSDFKVKVLYKFLEIIYSCIRYIRNIV